MVRCTPRHGRTDACGRRPQFLRHLRGGWPFGHGPHLPAPRTCHAAGHNVEFGPEHDNFLKVERGPFDLGIMVGTRYIVYRHPYFFPVILCALSNLSQTRSMNAGVRGIR